VLRVLKVLVRRVLRVLPVRVLRRGRGEEPLELGEPEPREPFSTSTLSTRRTV